MELKKRYNDQALIEFAEGLVDISRQIGFRVSARGWAYLLEQKRMINKDQFDKVNTLINTCRKKGFLPIDFVAEEAARDFSGVENVTNLSIQQDFASWLRSTLECADLYDLDWWEDEDYYIQMVVEKIDLVTLFSPVCRKYHIPIANSKGWGSILQRAEYARRFKEAEDKGMKCVLLYCGDYDPDGLRISEFIRKNLKDVSLIRWKDGTIGYNPENLIIDRFGLNLDFIQDNGFTWIDNLITGSKGYIAAVEDGKIVQGKTKQGRPHPNFNMPYTQEYLKTVGVRKCEANVIVTLPHMARELCTKSIEQYLGQDALMRFKAKREAIKKEFDEWARETGIKDKLDDLIDFSENY